MTLWKFPGRPLLLVLATVALACTFGPRGAAGDVSLIGSWKLTVTSQTDAPIPQLVTYGADGTTITSANQRPGANGQINVTTAGQGAWVQTGDHQFSDTFVSLIFTQTGDTVGSIDVTDNIALAADGQSFVGTFDAQVLDPDGNLETEGDGNESGTRIGGSTAATPAVDWTGSWSTNFGAMSLVQNGNTVIGTYVYMQGLVVGTVDGNVLRGTFTESPYALADTGDLELTLSADGHSFNGRWRYSTFPSGAWSTVPWTGVR